MHRGLRGEHNSKSHDAQQNNVDEVSDEAEPKPRIGDDLVARWVEVIQLCRRGWGCDRLRRCDWRWIRNARTWRKLGDQARGNPVVHPLAPDAGAVRDHP